MDICKKAFLKLVTIFFLSTSFLTIAMPIKYVDGVSIYSADGTKISANIYLPTGNQNKWPLVIMPNSWGLDEYEYTFPAKYLSERGYIVLSYSARGWGKSEGKINIASEDDLADVNAMISWAERELPIDPQRIGMAGISYGGGISLLAATKNPKIKAIAIMSAWSDLEVSLNNNDSPSKLFGSLLLQAGKMVGRLDPKVEIIFKNLVHHINMDEIRSWAYVRSPANFIDGLNKNQTSVYLSQNLGDKLFQPNGMLDLFKKLTTSKRMDLNKGGHASAEVTGLLGFDNYVWNQVYKWFDHTLKGIKNGMGMPPYLSIELQKDKRITANQWPIKSINKRFYFQGRPNFFTSGNLSEDFPKDQGSDKLKFGLITGVNAGLPIVSPILEAHLSVPIVTWLPGINGMSAVYYQTNPLKEDIIIGGIPHISLWHRSSLQKSQLIAYLYDVDKFGIGQLISHGPVSHYNLIPGNYISSEFDLAMAVHEVSKDHRIVLAIGTYDLLYAPPTTRDSIIQLAYGASMASNIVIPFINENDL